MIALTDSELQTLRDVFSRFSDISEVILFGSRARGTHRPSSDVDLALKGKNLGLDTLAKLRYILEEETNLPYFFDIVIYDRVEIPELKEHIDSFGEVIYFEDIL
jgi:uncharacterized protein